MPQKENSTWYSPYVKCDVCESKVEPDHADFDRISQMIVCKPCQPDFRSTAETEGARVEFDDVDPGDITWEEIEKDYDED